MGLDAVEIVIELEERFGISIQDEEAVAIRTVGDIHRLIQSRVSGRATGVCHSLPAFFKVRQFARDVSGDSKLRIKPSTSILATLSSWQRVKLWNRMNEICLQYPNDLRRPRWLRWVLLVIWIAAILLGFSTWMIDDTIVPLGVILAIGFCLLCQLMTTPWKTYPPEGFELFGALSQKIVGLTAATAANADQLDVEEEVRKILVDALGVDSDEVVPTARLVEDLQMT